MRSPIRLGHLQRRKPLSWQATALIHRSAHASLHRSVNPRAHVGASFTAVNDNRPLDVTLPSEGGCACVSSAGCRLRWPWSIKMRAAVLWTDRYLNFLSEPLPDVELLRTTEGGAACPVSVLDRDPSSPAFLFFVTIPRPWFGVAWKHHSGEKDNRFWRFKRLNKVHVFNIII